MPLRADETDPCYDWAFGESEAFNYISLNFNFLLIQTILIMTTRKVLQQGQVKSSKAVGVPVTLSAFYIYFITMHQRARVTMNLSAPRKRHLNHVISALIKKLL